MGMLRFGARQWRGVAAMKWNISLIFIAILLLSGCSPTEVEGHVYVVKGSGDVQPSAGTTVRLIPVANRVDLFYPASKAAFDEATAGIVDQLQPSCGAADEFIAYARSDLEDEIQEVRQRDSILDSGCSALDAEAGQLATEAEELENVHAERVAALDDKLRQLQAKRARNVASQAAEQRGRVLERITVGALSSPAAGRLYTGKISNSSDYCIGGTIGFELLAKGVKVGEEELARGQPDEFGFRTPCVLLPKGHRDAVAWTLDVDSAEARLLVSQHGLRTTQGFGAHVVPDEIALDRSGIKFFTLNSRQVGSSIEYSATPVDWSQVAIAGRTPEEDGQIASITAQLAAIEKAHAANPLVESAADARLAARSCAANEASLERLTSRLSILESAQSDLATCSGVDAGRAMAALISLNAEFDQGFEIPDLGDEYATAAVANVLSAILDDSVTDTEATIEGAYSFQNVDEGSYLLYSEYADSFVEGFWLKPVVVAGSVRLDLNHKSFVGVGLLDFLRLQFRNSCVGCSREEFKETLMPDADVVAMHGD